MTLGLKSKRNSGPLDCDDLSRLSNWYSGQKEVRVMGTDTKFHFLEKIRNTWISQVKVQSAAHQLYIEVVVMLIATEN